MSVMRSPSTTTRVSAVGITVSTASARPSRSGAITRSITSRLSSGRTASWMRTMSPASAPTAVRPARVDSLRVAPPGTTLIGAPKSPATASCVSFSHSAFATTTTWSMSPLEASAAVLRRSTGSPARRMNCFGVASPKRCPVPPARMTPKTFMQAAYPRRAGR